MANFGPILLGLGAAFLLFRGKGGQSGPDDWGNEDRSVAEGAAVSNVKAAGSNAYLRVPYRIYVMEDGETYYWVIKDKNWCEVIDSANCVRGEFSIGAAFFDAIAAAENSVKMRISGDASGGTIGPDDWGVTDVMIGEGEETSASGDVAKFRIYKDPSSGGAAFYYTIRNESWCTQNPAECIAGVYFVAQQRSANESVARAAALAKIGTM